MNWNRSKVGVGTDFSHGHPPRLFPVSAFDESFGKRILSFVDHAGVRLEFGSGL